MDALDCILTRRSVRKYTGKPLSEDQLHTILRAGFSAPTAKGTRPWHFVVVRDDDTLQAITKVHPFAQMLPGAGCGIIACGDSKVNPDAGHLTEDCSAALENMLLAAHALGLGAVWLGLHPREERVLGLRKLLGIPDSVLPVGMIAVGVSAEKKDAPDRYEAGRVHFEKWQEGAKK
jgi:nitroreductase